MADYTFLQPDGGPISRDGGGYTRNLVAALQNAGHHAAITQSRELPAGSIAVIDEQSLSAVTPLAAAHAIGLIHHASSLTGDQPQSSQLLASLGHIITSTAAAAMHLSTAFSVPPTRITVIPPGVPDAARSTGSGGAACEILTVGALLPRTDHAVLIEALLKLRDLDWRLTIVGSSDREPATTQALHRLAEPAGDRVRFAGPLHDPALEALWRGADLFALAAAEGHGAAISEALRRGIPAAVTNTSAPVTPLSGVICEAGDVVQLSKALRRMIYDTALRAAMADAAWTLGASLPSWTQQAQLFATVTA